MNGSRVSNQLTQFGVLRVLYSMLADAAQERAWGGALKGAFAFCLPGDGVCRHGDKKARYPSHPDSSFTSLLVLLFSSK